MSVRLLFVLSLCSACSTAIPQPEPPDPPVGEFAIHARIEGVDLEAPTTQTSSKRFRLRVPGEHTTEELITRFVSRARRAGAIAVSDLAVDAVVLKERRFYRCTANVSAKRQERLVHRTKTIPATVETKVRTFVFIGDSVIPESFLLVEKIKHPEEIVSYKQWQAGLQIESSNERCNPIIDLDNQAPSQVAGRVHFDT